MMIFFVAGLAEVDKQSPILVVRLDEWDFLVRTETANRRSVSFPSTSLSLVPRLASRLVATHAHLEQVRRRTLPSKEQQTKLTPTASATFALRSIPWTRSRSIHRHLCG